MRAPLRQRSQRGLPLRAVAPNAVTALALCFGLTGIRYAISASSGLPGTGGDWEIAAAMIMIAGVLDGLDGTVARLVRGESRFGAELDSLSDAISFGVSPALILYLWSLKGIPRLGWLVALVFAVFCALRLARFNANIDVSEQPHKSAGFLTGIPAPAGAGLAMLPLYLSFVSQSFAGGAEFAQVLRSPLLVAPWVGFIASLMVSSVATFSWSSLKLRHHIRFEALVVVVLLGGALIVALWFTLSVICIAYLALIPFSIRSYRRVRRLRGTVGAGAEPQPPASQQDGPAPESGAR